MRCPKSLRGGAEQQHEDETKLNSGVRDQQRATAGELNQDTALGQAEQRSMHQDVFNSASSSDMVTPPTLQCHTKLWPVLRYVGIQDLYNADQILTPNFDKDRAKQTPRAEPRCNARSLTGQPPDGETKPNRDGNEQPEVIAGKMSRYKTLGQAEQRSMSQKDDIISASSSDMLTLNSIQCQTIQWPVFRYVGIHDHNVGDQALTSNFALDNDRAEQTSRAEPGCTAMRLTEVGQPEQGLDNESCGAERAEVSGWNAENYAQHRIQVEPQLTPCGKDQAEKFLRGGNMTCQNSTSKLATFEETQSRKSAHKKPDLKVLNNQERQENSRRKEDEHLQECSRRLEDPRIEEENKNPKLDLRQCWKVLRESIMQLKGISNNWEELELKHTRRLEREEKKIRQELIDRKRKKFGRAGKTTITELEEAIISSNGRKKQEIEEIRMNLAKETIRKEGWKAGKLSGKLSAKKKIPEGRKLQPKCLQIKESKEEIELARLWQIVSHCIEQIEMEEQWIDSNRLERSSQEEQKSLLVGKAGNIQQQPRRDIDKMQHHSALKRGGQDEHMKAGLFQKDGLFQRGGRPRGLDEMHGLDGLEMRDITTQRRDITTAFEDTTNHENFSDKLVENTDDKKKPKSSLEEICRQEDRRTNGSVKVMFGRNEDVVFGRKEVLTRPEKNIPNGDMLLERKSEMHATTIERSAARLTPRSEMHCQERSLFSGRVVKTKRGTPAKLSRVKSLRKLFEKENPSSPGKTRGSIELLLQSTLDINPFNLEANHTGTKQTQDIRVIQSRGGIGTGPRQPCGEEFRPECDWPSQASLRLGNQSSGSLQDRPRPGLEK